MSRPLFFSTLFLLSLFTISAEDADALHPRKKIPSFGIEGPFRHTVIPAKAIEALNEAAKQDGWEQPCEFNAWEVDLNGDGMTDYVVSDSGSCIGADIGPIWIVLNEGGNYRVVLATSGHDIDLLPGKTHGLKNIEIHGSAATIEYVTRYRYRKGEYQPARCWEVEHTTGKRTYDDCKEWYKKSSPRK
jgi:hypothetical protein